MPRRIFALSLSLVVAVMLVPVHAAAQEEIIPILELANPERIQGDVAELADSQYRGRATGTDELIRASHYIRDQFARAGMHPAVGDTSYFQRFHVDYNEIRAPASLSAVAGPDTLHFELLRDFLPDQHSGSGNFPWSNLVVLDSSAAASRYAGAKEHVVLYLPPRVHQADPDLDAFDARRLPVRHQLQVAQALDSVGALAMLVPGIIYGRIGMEAVAGLPIFVMTTDAVDRMETAALDAHGLQVSGDVHSRLHVGLDAVNVVGMWRGSDPNLADDFILVCAHTDHVGTIAGAVHPGAHDNASGTAVMLEVARLFGEASDQGMQPKRSILFIGFSGEEMGLVGSRYYVEEEPVVPLENTTAVLNLDIVGGGTGFMMVGALNFPHYHDLVAGVNDDLFGHELRRRDNAPNSDHFFFGDRGIPAAFLYALEGPPVGIHTPTDTADRMDPAFMADAARFAFAVTWRLANLDAPEAERLQVQAAP